MRDDTIEYKVKVFISSKIGGRYNIVRKALKALLSETNIAHVYVFEDTLGSSQFVTQSYITKLDDSDICLFLIDNKDGVSESVLREQKRSRELGLKCIYLFCDEEQKDPTQIQKEIISSLREKIYVIHEFSDFTTIGYRSLMQDIIDIYRNYCKGHLINKSIDQEISELKHQYLDVYTIDEQLFSRFDITKNSLINTIYHSTREVKETSDLDQICKRFLYIVIGKEDMSCFEFNNLITELRKIHINGDVFNFIDIRWKAIKSYFNNELDECISNLRSAYSFGLSNSSIPNWMVNDVLIDMRNILGLLDETKSQFSIDNEAQRLLEANKESVYYPLIDRCETNLKQDLSKSCFKHFTETPYTTRFGGLEPIFDNISKVFVISVLYGSLTHILITRNRIADALSNLIFIYRDHSIYIELLSALILCQNDNEINLIIRAYNQTTEMINEVDAEKLYRITLSEPIKHKRMISKLIVFGNFGYYFSDVSFSSITNEIFQEIDNWIEDDNRVFNVSTYIFKALTANIRRIDNNGVSRLVLKVVAKGLKRWYDDVLKIIKLLDFSMISKETSISLIECLLKFISDENTRSNCSYLSSAIIYVRKNCCFKHSEIDKGVSEHMQSFYSKDYSLEVLDGKDKDSFKHIDRFIQEIHMQNNEQGKNGRYSGWGGNAYQTIINIIKYDKLDLTWENIMAILEAIEETIFSERQTVAAKISSIQLLVFLNNNNLFKKDLYQVYEKWIERETIILRAHEDGIFEKETIETLKFNILIMQISFGVQEVNNLLTLLSILTQQNDYEIIKSLESIQNLLYNIDFNNLDSITTISLLQYVIGMSKHKEQDVRYYSLRILFLLYKSAYDRVALTQISRMMDNDNYIIKANILNRLHIIKDVDIDIADLIKQKGRADNHFLVRKLSN